MTEKDLNLPLFLPSSERKRWKSQFCPQSTVFVAIFRRASADGHLFNPHENGHLPNSSLGPFAMMIGKNINKICHLLMTLLCILAFLSLTFVSLTQLLSKDVGTIVKVETGPEHPDMTLCSFGYNTRNYSELITQLPHPDYTLNDTRWVWQLSMRTLKLCFHPNLWLFHLLRSSDR